MSTLKLIPFSTSIDKQFSGRTSILGGKCCLQIDGPKTTKKQSKILVEKIRERISNGKVVDISASAYDTAWVAMVPSREMSGRPSFPECLDWIVENQNPDGSWGLNPFLVKDSLSCTLACLLALRKWGLPNHLLHKGIEFIESNISRAATDDENQVAPIGFNIIFPAMISYAKELDLTLTLPPSSLNALLRARDSEMIRRREGKWEYVGEGLGDSCNWNQIIQKHQSRNGSLFNSPATTAAAAIHCRDHKCFDYLISVVNKCNGWAPTVYPMDIYARLCMIDTLQRLGIDCHFRVELDAIFDEIYRNWQEREEEIFSDVTCQALAFRLLRVKGYDVSSDGLEEFVEQEGFFNSVSMQHSNVGTVLELYRASQTRINEEENTLEKIHAWTKPFLTQQLLNKTIRHKPLQKQVEYDLKNFYGTVDRFQHRRTIDLYDAQASQILKTAYRCSAIHNEDFIRFSVQNFKICRAEYQKELDEINKWYAYFGMDLLSKGRNACEQSYVVTAGLIADVELSMARISFAQVAILITVFDDVFDRYGTREEALAVIHLIKEWKAAPKECSQLVKTTFTALYDTVNETAAKAHALQGFCFKQQIISLWVELLECAVREKESLSGKNVSTLDEYLSFAPVTIGCKLCVLTAVHFLGIQVSEEMLTSAEMLTLCWHGNVVCRLLNDLKTYSREREEKTVNSVSVQAGVSEEEAVAKVKEVLEYHRRKVVKMVYQSQGSNVPRECKELVWKTCKVAHCFYGYDGDEFSSPRDIVDDIKAMMFLDLPHLSTH
nr:KSL3 protein [Isodon rubescens]